MKLNVSHVQSKIQNIMTEPELKKRTKLFALRILKLADALPKTPAGRAIANQIVRCGPSVAANYRAACRGRSVAEFIAKLGTVEEESDESAFWLELIMDAKLLKHELVESLYEEANELTAIFASSIITARKNKNKSKITNEITCISCTIQNPKYENSNSIR